MSVRFASALMIMTRMYTTTTPINVRCIKYVKHKDRYTEARNEYQKPIPTNVVCFTADMQKLTTKGHIFVSRLVVFNETFAAKTPGRPHYCILWNEAIAGRKAPDVASSYLRVSGECTNDENV